MPNPETNIEMLLPSQLGLVSVLQHQGDHPLVAHVINRAEGRDGVFKGWLPMGIDNGIAIPSSANANRDGPVVVPSELATETLKREAGFLDDLGGHPQIPSLFEARIEDEFPYILMQKMPNDPSLERRLSKTPGWALIVAQLSKKALDGLESAVHSKGVAHGDIKHRNLPMEWAIETDEGEVSIIDFSAARNLEEEALGVLRAGDRPDLLVATPHYMAPEQTKGVKPNKRTDIFSMGIVIADLLTIRTPLPGSATEIVKRPTREMPANAQSFDEVDYEALQKADVPPKLIEVIEGSVQADPAKRPESAGEMAEQLEQVVIDLSTYRRQGSGRPADQNRQAAAIAA